MCSRAPPQSFRIVNDQTQPTTIMYPAEQPPVYQQYSAFSPPQAAAPPQPVTTVISQETYFLPAKNLPQKYGYPTIQTQTYPAAQPPAQPQPPPPVPQPRFQQAPRFEPPARPPPPAQPRYQEPPQQPRYQPPPPRYQEPPRFQEPQYQPPRYPEQFQDRPPQPRGREVDRYRAPAQQYSRSPSRERRPPSEEKKIVPPEVLDIPPRHQPPVRPEEYGGAPDLSRREKAGLIPRTYGQKGQYSSVWAYQTPLNIQEQNPVVVEDGIQYYMYDAPRQDPAYMRKALTFSKHPLNYRAKGMRQPQNPAEPSQFARPSSQRGRSKEREAPQEKKSRWNFFKRNKSKGGATPQQEQPRGRQRSQSYPPPGIPWQKPGTAGQIFPDHRLDIAAMNSRMDRIGNFAPSYGLRRAYSPERIVRPGALRQMGLAWT